ncbi:hypothetical protein NM688_g8253 [Phlebia brevispora]|uniref:Uncharacterized protein n=1 Tax=Phlebia brevispora TaxID=194682 RepID=A0ACC1RVB0_9APHY|nr:hypothetical protein NM688_g8253 [Phlebia brevispora]
MSSFVRGYVLYWFVYSLAGRLAWAAGYSCTAAALASSRIASAYHIPPQIASCMLQLPPHGRPADEIRALVCSLDYCGSIPHPLNNTYNRLIRRQMRVSSGSICQQAPPYFGSRTLKSNHRAGESVLLMKPAQYYRPLLGATRFPGLCSSYHVEDVPPTKIVHLVVSSARTHFQHHGTHRPARPLTLTHAPVVTFGCPIDSDVISPVRFRHPRRAYSGTYSGNDTFCFDCQDKFIAAVATLGLESLPVCELFDPPQALRPSPFPTLSMRTRLSSPSLAMRSMLLSVLGFVQLAACASNGMDMSTDGPMDLTMGQMLPYLHFTPGDMLWFMGWVPSSSGAMVGACIAFVLLGMLERWIAACKAVMQAHWARRAQIVRADRVNLQELPVSAFPHEKQASAVSVVYDKAITFRTAPPFVWSHELARGIMHAGHAALQYALMLAVMTFQLGFILSLIFGLGVGEMLFGRYTSHALGPGHY